MIYFCLFDVFFKEEQANVPSSYNYVQNCGGTSECALFKACKFKCNLFYHFLMIFP